jgi:hypothetical protein
MSPRAYFRFATLLGAAGVVFSGYLSLTRMTRGVCAFDESCPFFLGYPACYTGFALFATAFLVSIVALVGKVDSAWPMVANVAVSAAGILFAGRMTITELAEHRAYRLGLPTCAYGFVFFVALLVLSLSAWVRRSRPHHLAPR